MLQCAKEYFIVRRNEGAFENVFPFLLETVLQIGLNPAQNKVLILEFRCEERENEKYFY